MEQYKFITENRLDTFEYHDAYLNKLSIDDNKMIWEVQFINVKTTNKNNTYPVDMCIKEAIIEFEEFKIDKMERMGWRSFDDKNNVTHQEPNYIYQPEEYETQLLEITPQDKFIIIEANHSERNDGTFKSFFWVELLMIEITYKRALIKWNDYIEKAWYVDFNKTKEEE